MLKKTDGTNTIKVIACNCADVPLGDYALIPTTSLDVAVSRFGKWKRLHGMPVPETVYQTKLGFYFPLEAAQ